MTLNRFVRRASTMVLALAGVTAGTGPAVAADDPVHLELPAGVACPDFALGIDIVGGNQVYREFTDRDGNPVRTLSAGTGSELTFTNLATYESLTLGTGGSVTQVRHQSDGSTTWKVTGHNVLILFPMDVPAGPSTTLHIGSVTFTVDTAVVFTVQEVRARSTSICTSLSS